MLHTTIRQKLCFVCAFVTLSLAAGGCLYTYILHTQAEARLEDQRVGNIELGMEKLRSGILEARRREKDFLIRPDQRYVQKHQFTMESNYNRLEVLSQLFDVKVAVSYINEITEFLREYEKQFNEVVLLTVESQKTGADNQSRINDLIRTYKMVLAEIAPKTEALSTIVAEVRDDNASYQEQRVIYTTTIIGVSMLVFGLIVISVLGLLMRSVTSSLHTTIDAMRDIAEGEGDLVHRLDSSRKDELGHVAGAFNLFVSKIRDLVLKVYAASTSMAVESKKLEERNEVLSARTDEQAQSLAETAASMKEMTDIIKNNAEFSRKANHLAGTACEEAEFGGDAVNMAIKAMGELNDSSNKISEITTTIKSIAFQTNLLALNAAVEAARAGEEGRGFAVVAAEVRVLSQRCAEASKEIELLVADSVKKVEVGTTLVDESGKIFFNILNGIKGVADMVHRIDTASQEQSAGIEHVNSAVTEMNILTQKNAVLVEETRVASQAMKNQAYGMIDLMGGFKVDEEVDGELECLNSRSSVSFKSKLWSYAKCAVSGLFRLPGIALRLNSRPAQ